MSLPQQEKSIAEVQTLAPGHDTSVKAAPALPSMPAAEAPTLVPPSANAAEAATPAPPSRPSGQFESKLAEATHVDLAAGILGPYREVRRLRAWKSGAIYSGTVYSAVHPRLRRHVELLVLDDDSLTKEPGPCAAGREAFLKTARKAAAIHHPNVETGLLEAATYGGVTFVSRDRSVLELLDGFGPRNRAERRRELLYPNGALAQALFEAARGLAEIHRAGLRHGHITRAVLRRGAQGQVCLTALRDEPAGSNLAPPMSEGLEQEAVQKDLTDLGSAFAELVCARVPVLGGPPGTRAKRLRRLNPGLSRHLADILERCLTTESPRRFKDVQELVQEVEKLTKFEIVPAEWSDRSGSHLYDVAAFALPIVCITTLFVAKDPFGLANKLDDALTGEESWKYAYFLCVVFAAYLLSETAFGWTPGRRLRGLRLRDVTGSRAPRWRILVRCLCRFAFLLAVSLGISQLGFDALWRIWGQDQHAAALLEYGLPIYWISMVMLVPFLALAGLYSTSVCTPDHRPLHDYLTGVSWFQRRPRGEFAIEETVESARGALLEHRDPIVQCLAPGQVLGRMDQYELRGLLGQGGMGAVYEARDLLLERRVAIKVLNCSTSATPTVLQRFEREARLAAQLSHPNVAQVFGFGETGGQPYIVMEFVDGENLQQLVQREGAMPLARAWECIRQTALALREASRHGIVHRDVKPANIMLDANSVVKVTDFGISRSLGDEEEKTVPTSGLAPSPCDASLTKTGAVLGTPLYLSPEQSRGEKLDGRCDIYSLGMTLYFVVSGRPPFDGGDIYDLVMCQCNEEPASLTGKVAGWTHERNAVLRRMIAKDRSARFQNYDELLKELDAAAPKPPTVARFGRRASATLINFLLVFGFGTGIVWVFRALMNNQQTALASALLLDFVLFSGTYVIGIGRWGALPGQWLLRLKVIRPGRLQVGFGRAFLRFLILYPACIGTAVWSVRILVGDAVQNWRLISFWFLSGTFYLTCILWAISCCLIPMTARRRGLHDFVAGTMVVKSRTQQGGWSWLLERIGLRR